MSKTFQIILAVMLACFIALSWGLNTLLQMEKSKEIILEAAVERQSGDVMIRIQDDPLNRGTVFEGMCGPRIPL